jgi:sec-independent protein translocase protein TatB
MNFSELLLILVVALLVFGPKKLPMLAYHLGKLVGQFNHYKQQLTALWQHQLNEHQLQENLKKAQKADENYQQAPSPNLLDEKKS